MPSRSPRKNKARYSDPSNASLTPLTGTFSRLSASSRAQSLSPRKKDSKQPVHIRMHLTETQVDKITDVVSRSVDGNSPTKNQESLSSKPAVSGHQSLSSRHARMRSSDSDGFDHSESKSTLFEDLLPRPSDHASTVSLAERRKRFAPTPIHVEDARRFVKATPQRARMETVPDVVSPLNPEELNEAERNQQSQSSYYPSEYHLSQQPEPLNIRHSHDCDAPTTPCNPFEPYREWVEDSSRSKTSRVRMVDRSPPKQLHRAKSSIGGQGYRSRGQSASPEKQAYNAMEPTDTPAFSPFPYYFRSEDFPSEKKGQKNMFGEKGWLERTDVSPDKAKKGTAKKLGFLDGIKKMAKDVTAQYHPARRANNPVAARETLKSQTTTTLSAREQSLLYCELEFNLCNSLNTFIKIQLDRGRVDTDKLKKIGDAWVQQGRPRVVGFRYDLETQLELITLHVDDFVFSGRRQGNPTEIAALLYTMKVNARAMRIKTFCSPDSVIAKQLVDSQSLFNLIGAPSADNYALEECAHFYKLCLERESERQAKQRKNTRTFRTDGWTRTQADESLREN